MDEQKIEWFNLSEPDKVKEVYSKFTLVDFWNFWSDGKSRVMEVRIKDWDIKKKIHEEFGYPYSMSGVFVKDSNELKNVIAVSRDRHIMWFGTQPRRKVINKKGYKNYGGSDVNVDEIVFLFLDIDRTKKEGEATPEELRKIDLFCNKILEKLGAEGWINSYMKIATGNGIQLLIRLDSPIKVPDVVYDKTQDRYIYDVEYENIKILIHEGIGKDLIRFNNKFKDEYNAEIDNSCFNMSRVGSLPFTKNFKYDSFRWRGIIDIKDNGSNEGLTQHIYSRMVGLEKPRVFKINTLERKHMLFKNKLEENPVVKFMLDNDLPAGKRNNYLWFQIKCLIRDSKIDMKSEEFKDLHRRLEQRHGTLTLNLPEPQFKFDEDIVNKFCIDNFIPPIYPAFAHRKTKEDMCEKYWRWDMKDEVDGAMHLDEDSDIMQDMAQCKKLLKPYDINNNEIIALFVKELIKKYGEQKTRYYYDWLFVRFFCYR